VSWARETCKCVPGSRQVYTLFCRASVLWEIEVVTSHRFRTAGPEHGRRLKRCRVFFTISSISLVDFEAGRLWILPLYGANTPRSEERGGGREECATASQPFSAAKRKQACPRTTKLSKVVRFSTQASNDHRSRAPLSIAAFVMGLALSCAGEWAGVGTCLWLLCVQACKVNGSTAADWRSMMSLGNGHRDGGYIVWRWACRCKFLSVRLVLRVCNRTSRTFLPSAALTDRLFVAAS
jgi:hypothetical protein